MDLILHWVLYPVSLRNQILLLWEPVIKKIDKAGKDFKTYLEAQADIQSLGKIAYYKRRLEWPGAVL